MKDRFGKQLVGTLLSVTLFQWALVSCGGGTVNPPNDGPPVENLNDTGPGSLRDAVANARAGDLITLSVTGKITLSSQILVNKSLNITGPGSGKLTISGGNVSRIFDIPGGSNTSGEVTKVSISGLTLADGNADKGGAVYNAGDLTISDSVLTNNRASDSGGAIYNAGGTNERRQSFTLLNTTISNNTAAVHGGGVFNFNFSQPGYINAIIRNSAFTGNVAGTGSGGAMVVGGANTLTLADTSVSENWAAQAGGGLFLEQTVTVDPGLIITDSTIAGNVAGEVGGGILFLGDLIVTRTTIADNTASLAGGGLHYGRGSKLTLAESTVSGNKVEAPFSYGGGIRGFVVDLINSTVTGNEATSMGGGMFVNILTAVHSTVAGNRARDQSGGIDLGPSGGASVKNSIIANNTSALGPDFFMNTGSTLTSLGHNLVGSAVGNTFVNGINNDFVGIAPQLGALADNGGPTQTLALQAGSPAIDAVPVAQCGGITITTDQRGIARPQGSACDIGAFEKN